MISTPIHKDDGINQALGLTVLDDHLHSCFRGEEHLAIGTPLGLTTTAPVTESMDLANRHTLDI